MKIISAIDSMKGSLSSIEANEIIGNVFQSEETEVVKIAIADGGEGTVEAFVTNAKGECRKSSTLNLLGEKIQAPFGWLEKEQTAIIETAAAAGIQFLDFTESTHPKNTSSVGVGKQILAAIDSGAETIIIGLGGTGTVDGGIGALFSLGVQFYDARGEELLPIGSSLGFINSIDTSNLDPRVHDVKFILASDVKSTLTGKDGAVYMFGKQKGIQEEEFLEYEEAMKNYEQVILRSDSPRNGDGAAGGLGIAFRKILNAEVQSGLELVIQHSKFKEELKTADLVITGEGRIDTQSLQGKVPVGIAKLAKEHHLPVIAFAGSVEGDDELFEKVGIDVVLPIVDKVTTLDDALSNAKRNLRNPAIRAKKLLYLEVNKEG